MRSSSRLANAYNKPIIVTSDFKLDIKVNNSKKTEKQADPVQPFCKKVLFERKRFGAGSNRFNSFLSPTIFDFDRVKSLFFFPFKSLQNSHVHGKIRGKATRLETREKG